MSDRRVDATSAVGCQFLAHEAPTGQCPRSRRRTGSPDTPANQRAVLISDANTPGCLPSNGYMNSTTTSTLGFVFVQLHSEHIIFNTLWNGLD